MSEIAKQEFRQIKKIINVTPLFEAVVDVQQKYLVKFGDLYSPEFNGPPERETDIFSHVGPDGRALWFPVKVVWKSLSVAHEKNDE